MNLAPLLTRFPALGFPLYRRYWGASFASVGATQLITMGQGWLIYELTGSALQLGLLGAAAALPNMVMTFLGGVIADRFDKRRIMLVTSSFSALLMALLAWLDATGAVAVWHVLSVAALFSLTTGIDWPARVAIFPQLVERVAYMSAVALNSFVWQASRMIMPAFGGALIHATDTWVLFALAACGFAAMGVVVYTLPRDRGLTGTPGSAASQISEGIRFIWQTPLFLWLLAATFTGMFFYNAYVQILPVFADLLGGGEQAFGTLLSAGGVGAVAGTLAMGGVGERKNLGALMLGGAAASVLTIYAFCVAAAGGFYGLSLFLVFLSSACASVFLIGSMTVMQLSVPDRLRGRVMGIHTMGFSLMPLGGLLLGALAEQFSGPIAVALGASVYLALIVWLLARRSEVARLDGRALSAEAGGT